MLLRSFILVFLTFILSTGQAAPLTAVQLKEMLKKYQKDLFLQGQVKQEKLIKELDLRLKSEGLFEIHKSSAQGLTIDWNIKKPENLHVCIEGSTLYIQDSNQKAPIQQDLNKVDDQSQGSFAVLRTLMEMDTDRLLKDFSVYKAKDQLTLESKKVTVHISLNKDDLFKQIKFVEASGDELKIDFVNVKQLKQNASSKKCLERLVSKK